MNRRPATQDITYYRGDTQGFPYVVGLNLTGCTLLLKVKTDLEVKSKALIELTLDNGGIVVNAIDTANSNTTITIKPAGDGSDEAMLAKAEKLPADGLYYDLQATSGTDVFTIMAGSFSVTGDVS